MEKLYFEEMRAKLRELHPNLVLLSTEYKNQATPLSLHCSVCETPIQATWKALNSGRGTCPKCRVAKRRTPEAEILKAIQERDCTLISSLEGYQNKDWKFEVKCNVCEQPYETSYGKIKYYGCPHCAGCKKKTQEEVEKFFADKGHILKSVYQNAHAYLDVICDRSHPYQIKFYYAQNGGGGCPKCNEGDTGRWSTKRLDDDVLNERLRGKNLGLLLIEGSRVQIECEFGHVTWLARVLALGKDSGFCTECGTSAQNTHEEVMARYAAFGFKLLSPYKNARSELLVECPAGHQQKTSLKRFIANKNRPPCRVCKHEKQRKHSVESIQRFLDPLGYTILTKAIQRVDDPIQVRCDKGHVYDTKFNQMIYHDQLCIACNVTKPERGINLFLDELGVSYQIHNRELIKPFEIDAYVTEKKLAIELCGNYWHSDRIKDAKFHTRKLGVCRKAGIRVLMIYESEWNHQKEIVKSILRHHLGLDSRKLSARDGEIREIDYKTSKSFFEKNHVMGATTHKALGLFIQGELVSAMSYKIKGKEMEIVRFSSLLNTSVRGAFGKFLSKLRAMPVTNIISFVDLRYGDGHSYIKLGFEKTGVTLGWKWTNFHKTFNRLACRANMDARKLSQEEYAEELGWAKIYDCGQEKYRLTVIPPNS